MLTDSEVLNVLLYRILCSRASLIGLKLKRNEIQFATSSLQRNIVSSTRLKINGYLPRGNARSNYEAQVSAVIAEQLPNPLHNILATDGQLTEAREFAKMLERIKGKGSFYSFASKLAN